MPTQKSTARLSKKPPLSLEQRIIEKIELAGGQIV